MPYKNKGEKQCIRNMGKDEKVNYIKKCLSEGMTREETARKLGYRDWHGLDIYMRRRGYAWSPLTNSYYEKMEKLSCLSQEEKHTPSKALKIIARFSLPGADPMSIAREFGFSDNREMSSYMLARGYKWSMPHSNYISGKEPKGRYHKKNEGKNVYIGDAGHGEAGEYTDILDILQKNRERILELLEGKNTAGTIPRYVVPGIARTKSFYMSDTLSELVAEFSRTKNISQKEIIETAIIEFLRKYSFKDEVDAALGT
jgi:hypothetical protein